MSKAKFRVVAGGLITCNGKLLLGKKEEVDDHPLSGQWHLPGGHVDKGESPEEALKREIEEETGLEGEVHQLVEVEYSGDIKAGRDDMMRIVYHFEADSKDAEAQDDLQDVKWIDPSEFESEAGEVEKHYLEKSRRVENFIEKLKKMPAF